MSHEQIEQELRQQALSQRIKEREELLMLWSLITASRSSVFDLPPKPLTDEEKAHAQEGWEILRIKTWEGHSLKEAMKCLLLVSKPDGRTSFTGEQKAKAREGWEILKNMCRDKALEALAPPKAEVASPEDIAKAKGAGEVAALKAAADAAKNKARLRKEQIAKERGLIDKRW
jgi:hypothetical protein